MLGISALLTLTAYAQADHTHNDNKFDSLRRMQISWSIYAYSGFVPEVVMTERLTKQMQFIFELDRLKSVFRKTRLFDGSRLENDAEHSWHLAVMCLVLSEYSNQPVDMLKVIKMLLVHDIAEIDTGDFFIYFKDDRISAERESEAAERIFGLLPDDLKSDLMALWKEFEEGKTSEARFALAIDRLEPVMQNFFNDAHSWKDNGVCRSRVLEINGRIRDGSAELWNCAKAIIDECAEKGLI